MNMVKAEWKRLAGKPLAILTVVGLLFVPFLYGLLFLSAYWDPYGKTDQLPVAVVNEDKGADYNGKRLSIGEDFVKSLGTDDTLDWHVSSKAEALRGLENEKYYLVIVLPEDFSADAATVMDEQPQKMQFVYYTNPGKNYPASQIANSAVLRIHEQINREVTETYAQTLFSSLADVAGAFGEAAEGAGRIESGAAKLSDNMQRFAASAEDLQTGAGRLKSGAAQVDAGAKDLADGLVEAKAGAERLDFGLGQTKTGASKLEAGAASLKQGLAASATGANEMQKQLSGLADGLNEASAALARLAEAQEDVDLKQLAERIAQLAQGGEQAVQASAALSESQAQLFQGASSLSEGSSDLVAGIERLGEGSDDLMQGVETLRQGAVRLKTGATSLSRGTGDLASGAGEFAAGADALAQGAEELSAGSAELRSSLEGGAEQAGIHADEETVDMFASPSELAAHKEHNIMKYGVGLAPYIISIALYAGALMFSSAYSLKRPAIRPDSALSWFFSKFTVVIAVGIGSSLLIDAVLLWGLGLEVQSVWRFGVFTMLTSLTFFSIILFLFVLLNTIGQYLAFILLLLQIGGSGGTFPSWLTPDFYRAIHPFLPMTHAINGFREVIAIGNDYGFLWRQGLYLGGYSIAFFILAYGAFALNLKRPEADSGLA